MTEILDILIEKEKLLKSVNSSESLAKVMGEVNKLDENLNKILEKWGVNLNQIKDDLISSKLKAIERELIRIQSLIKEEIELVKKEKNRLAKNMNTNNKLAKFVKKDKYIEGVNDLLL